MTNNALPMLLRKITILFIFLSSFTTVFSQCCGDGVADPGETTLNCPYDVPGAGGFNCPNTIGPFLIQVLGL